MLAVVSTIDSFGTVNCVLANLVVLSTGFCFLNPISEVPDTISLLLPCFVFRSGLVIIIASSLSSSAFILIVFVLLSTASYELLSHSPV